ncbi:prolyl oligopeptidase family serine peptidase [Micromonospora sp. NPDC000089]|uniref:prolyl oligopeptidase family serine peptidase n=1 Tax=unclassified Micromonospora TaxID=2617518 RepID=UPI00368A71F0
MTSAPTDPGPAQPDGRPNDRTRPLGDARVPDDLGWLRDPDRGPALRDLLRRERAFHDEQSRRFAGQQDALTRRALDLLPPTAATPTWSAGAGTFHWHWPHHSEHPRLVRVGAGRGADTTDERVVLDVAGLSDTGFVRLGDAAVDPTGELLAYTVDVTGDEAYRLRVRELATGRERKLSDRVYYGLAWSPDGQRLLSVRADAADRPYQLWCHRPRHDGPPVLLHQEDDERFHLGLRTSGDGRYAVLRAAARLTAEEWLLDLTSAETTPRSAGGRTEGHDYLVEPVLLDGRPHLVVCAETDADRYVIGLHRGHRADTEPVRVLLPPAATRRPRTLAGHDGLVVATGRQDGLPALWVLDPGRTGPITTHLADPGTTFTVAPYDSPTGTVCLAGDSLRQPSWFDTLDLRTGAVTTRLAAAPAAPAAPTVVERLTVTARDGAQVPVTVLRRRDVPLDGAAPCLLYGYGAWETVIEPTFDPARLALVEAGVVYAHAHVRGGGELGRAWWRAGRTADKHRTFDDFVDVARRLRAGLVDPERIVARGLSAGGLLMGVAYSTAPDLFAGVVAEAPFVDPVTTMSDPTAPLVVVERDEWGDPRREPDLRRMLSWSPYDNPPPPGGRPRLLVTSAINDPRVSVWEPARWVTRLRADQTDPAAVLFRVDLGPRGHWAPPGRHESVAFHAALLAWAADTMDLPVPGRRDAGHRPTQRGQEGLRQ